MSTSYLPSTDTKHYIVLKNQVIELTKGSDGLWRDADGGVYAYADAGSSVDDKSRCGVGIFSLPESSYLTPACAIHDYQYSSPAYQAFHTRQEADRALRRNIKTIVGSPYNPVYLLGQLFKSVVDTLGSQYWDNKNTR